MARRSWLRGSWAPGLLVGAAWVGACGGPSGAPPASEPEGCTGDLRCDCFENGTCNSGLSCISGICVEVPEGSGGAGLTDGGTAGEPGPGEGGSADPTGGGTTGQGGTSSPGGSATGGSTGGREPTAGEGGQDASGGTDGEGGVDATGGDAGQDSGGSPDGGAAPIGGAGESGGTGGSAGAPPDLSGILTFGERPTSRFQGVTRDTEVRANQPTLNFGAMDEMASDTEPDRLALIAFDLSVIPATSSVSTATLKLWTKGEGSGCDSTSDAMVPFYPLMEAWDEGSGPAQGSVGFASWSFRVQGTPWTIPGLDVGTRGSVPAGVVGPVLLNTEHSIALAPSVVESWLTADANHGLVIWFKPADSNGVCFLTSESADGAKRPELAVVLDD